jgi:predicted methyltransferase
VSTIGDVAGEHEPVRPGTLSVPAGSIERAVLAVPAAIPYGLAIGMSAFLLFTLEPIVGRLVLPVFGGAAGVWATVLAFFQAVLLLGYLYAHLSATRLGVRAGIALHLVLALVAVVATLAAPARLADVPLDALPTLPRLVALLAIAVGPAAFVLTATTPLMSSWYARVRQAADPSASAADPYWLYALSNGASLVALLAYPFVIEPAIGLSAQRGAWIVGLGLLALVLVGASLRRLLAVDRLETVTIARADAAPLALTRGRRARWLLLSAVPAGLLSAVTNFVTTDLISAPLLWVVPLAIYLGSFVVAFSALGRARMVPLAIRLAPVAATLLWVPLGSSAGWPILALLTIEYLGLGILAVALHGTLASDRPPATGLTDFYLSMSTGGVIGGAFVGVLAPVIFDGVWEYPLLVVGALVALALPVAGATIGGPSSATAAMAAAPGTVPRRRQRPIRRLLAGSRERLVPYLVVAAILSALMAGERSLGLEAGVRWLLVGGLVLLVGGVRWFFAATTALVLVLATFVLPQAAIFRDRSFFGVVQVVRSDEATLLMHGTTVHGVEWVDPARRGDPGSYYARSGPIGDLFAVFDAAHPGGGVIRVSGLGAGTLAAYTRANDRITFYEIDPLVAEVASDTRYFDYLADAAGAAEIRIGDGRLLLENEPDASLDLVVLDAFSSDAIPIHLITVESFADALRALRPDGLLVVHVSNRYYDIAPVVAAAAGRLDLAILERVYVPGPEAQGAGLSDWMVAARSPELLQAFVDRGWVRPRVADQPFTDDFADLLHHLRPGGW